MECSQNKDKALEDLLNSLVEMKDSEKKAARIRDIVPIEEWINSEYYCGPDALSIYPYWKQHIINIFNSPVRINEVILTGSLGTGKTTIGNIIMLRKIYELSCYNNIPALFNLMASSKMLFAYFNLNMAQAEITGFGQLKEMIDNCPYFQEYFPRDIKNNASIKFLNANMTVRFASDNSHIIGSNLVAGLLDEANFYKNNTLSSESVIAQNKAANLYSDIRNRRKITFYGRWRKSIFKYFSFIFSI